MSVLALFKILVKIHSLIGFQCWFNTYNHHIYKMKSSRSAFLYVKKSFSSTLKYNVFSLFFCFIIIILLFLYNSLSGSFYNNYYGCFVVVVKCIRFNVWFRCTRVEKYCVNCNMCDSLNTTQLFSGGRDWFRFSYTWRSVFGYFILTPTWPISI